MLERHNPPVPETCDVCRYAVNRKVDSDCEHARVRLATLWLVHDLEELEDQSARLSGLTIGTVGVEPGPVHELEPRHWYWALLYEPDFRVSLNRRDSE